MVQVDGGQLGEVDHGGDDEMIKKW